MSIKNLSRIKTEFYAPLQLFRNKILLVEKETPDIGNGK